MTVVDYAIYRDGERKTSKVEYQDAYELCRKDGGFVWIGLYEPTEQEFESIRAEFELHPLAVEDAINAHQRPKLERYGDTLFLVLKTARYVDSQEVVQLGEILVFLGEDFIITVRHGQASDLHQVRERLEGSKDLLQCGPGAVLHAIVDKVVDDYTPAILGLQEDIDQVENEVFSARRPDRAERIYKLKREVLEFHRAAEPLVAPIDKLAAGRIDRIHPEVRTYFRDVNDHLMRAADQLENARDLLTSVLEANLSQVTVRQNEDMRKISAWVAIAAVPTAIAGVYGMNFEHMPELTWRYGYPYAIALMLIICTLLYRQFKKAGWL